MAAPDNGIHPTANSVALVRETWPLIALNARRLGSGVRFYRLWCGEV